MQISFCVAQGSGHLRHNFDIVATAYWTEVLSALGQSNAQPGLSKTMPLSQPPEGVLLAQLWATHIDHSQVTCQSGEWRIGLLVPIASVSAKRPQALPDLLIGNLAFPLLLLDMHLPTSCRSLVLHDAQHPQLKMVSQGGEVLHDATLDQDLKSK